MAYTRVRCELNEGTFDLEGTTLSKNRRIILCNPGADLNVYHPEPQKTLSPPLVLLTTSAESKSSNIFRSFRSRFVGNQLFYRFAIDIFCPFKTEKLYRVSQLGHTTVHSVCDTFNVMRDLRTITFNVR